MTDTDLHTIRSIVADAQRIVVMQADNPDADSLGSSLALEGILGDQGKDVWLYGYVEVPQYLRYLPGWDRVQHVLPSSFDAVIIVDASTLSLFECFQDANIRGIVSSKPVIVLDHHAVSDDSISFARVTRNNPELSSTGEVIYALAKQLDWPIDAGAGEAIMAAILGDTQGLTNELARSSTYHTMAALLESGVSRVELEDRRREYSKMPETIYRYKGELIGRTEFFADGKLALVTIPQAEINSYSALYNPAPLIQNDMLQTAGVELTIVMKSYDSGRVTAAIRANSSAPIAGVLAEFMGGGGHKYASGFKIEDGRTLGDIKAACISRATELLQG